MRTRALALIAMLSAAACGGAALKHTIPDKELVGVTGETATRLAASRGEVARAEDELKGFVVQVVDAEKQMASAQKQEEAAEESMEAANARIDSTRESEAEALKKAGITRDEQVAAATKAYEEEARAIRDRFGAEHAENQSRLSATQGQKALAELEGEYYEAQLARSESEKAVREQAVQVKRAELEQQKLDALQGLKATRTLDDEKRRLDFDKQVLDQKAELAARQEKLRKSDGELQALKSKVEQERARFGASGAAAQ